MADTPRAPEPGPARVEVVRGAATEEELHALHRVLTRRAAAGSLARWRATRRAALRRRPEVEGDR